MLTVDRPRTDIERRGNDAIRGEPLEGEHGANDIDDRVDGPHLVQVYLFHRHLVDSRLDLREPGEQADGTSLGDSGQTGAIDEGRNVAQTPVMMMFATGIALVIMIVVGTVVVVMAVFVARGYGARAVIVLDDTELGGSNAASVDAVGRNGDTVQLQGGHNLA